MSYFCNPYCIIRNKVRLLISCTLIILSHSFNVKAQKENYNWCFGNHIGVNWNNISPTTFIDSIAAAGGSTTVSDSAGNLLFYTSGTRVWDRNHTVMPNGAGLSEYIPPSNPPEMGTGMQGVVVVQSPANPLQYYIIATGNRSASAGKAYYSLVDMSLNNGLGDVVAGQKSILLVSNVETSILTAAINGGCTGYWVIFHRKNSAEYLAFKIDNSGISLTSVASTGLQVQGSQQGYYISEGTMCINAANNRLVRCVSSGDPFTYMGSAETALFNSNTGQLTNFEYLETHLDRAIYPIFSPDGSKLYLSDDNLFQYDFSLLPNILAVRNSKTLIADTGIFGGARNAPDGKLYIVRTNSDNTLNTTNFLARINSPNNPGISCGYVFYGLELPYNAQVGGSFSELGSVFLTKVSADTLISPAKDTTICYDQNLILAAPPDYESPVWSTGSTDLQETFMQPGTYWLRGIQHCTTRIDTFHIHYPDFEVNLGNDTNICEGKLLILDATVPGALSYFWQDGSANATYTVTDEGIYSVAVIKDGCTLSDTISVGIINPTLNIQEHDTTICKGEQITLHAIAFPESNFLWNTGSTSAITVTNGLGEHAVTATNICGTFHDSINIQEQICPCIVFVPNAFTPNGDGKNDVFEVSVRCPQMSGYTFHIYNRYGQKVFQSSGPSQSWDGSDNGRPADAGTYFFYLKYKDGTNDIKKKGDIVLVR